MNYKNFFALKLVFNPLMQVTQYWKEFFSLGLIFSFLLLILSYLFGQTFMCYVGGDLMTGCETVGVRGYLFYFVLKMFVVSVFVFLWYAKVFQKKSIDEKFILQNWRGYFRVFFIFCAILLLNVLPFVSVMYLLQRVPNPNWKIEMFFYSIGFVLVWLPFFVLPLYGVVADLIGGKGFKNLKTMWHNSRGGTLQVLLASLFVFMFCMMVIVSVMGSLQGLRTLPLYLYEFLSEYLFSLAFLFVTAFMICFFAAIRAQFLPAEAKE